MKKTSALQILFKTSLIALVCCLSFLSLPSAAEKVEPQKTLNSETESAKPTFDKLMDDSYELRKKGDDLKAAEKYYDIHLLFVEEPGGEEALWLAAELYKKTASQTKGLGWVKVRDLYRRYLNFYPKSTRVPAAYLELGKSFYFIKFYREAHTYFKLYLKRYPDSSSAIEAKHWLGKSLIKVGKYDDAEKLFSVLQKDKDADRKLIGQLGMADLRFVQGRYEEARHLYQNIIITKPQYYLKDPEILRSAGTTNIKSGKMDKGRDQLYHYLNLANRFVNRAELLFELGESFLQVGDFSSAQKLYKQAIEEARAKDDQAVFFSRLRIAQFLDNPESKLSKWAKSNDLNDSKGDNPYLQVLERFYESPYAQEARFGLFLRYKARKDLEAAYKIGRNFLRNADPKTVSSLEIERAGTMLLYLVKELLEQKRYQDIYDLYFVEYRHVKDFPNGRLLYLVGQAMEALNLYDQAAVVYYRAMKWPISEEDKVDLYYRRARVYLAQKDYGAADRLMKYLRKIYKDTPHVGEVYHYSGVLAEAQSNKESAMQFYIKAAENPTFNERQAEHVDSAFRLALEMGRNGFALEFFKNWHSQGHVKGLVAQEWALKIGNALRLENDCPQAIDIYQVGLSVPAEQITNHMQAMNLYLGDCFFVLGDQENGLKQFTLAKKGESRFWKKMADERFNQHDIDKELAEMKKTVDQ